MNSQAFLTAIVLIGFCLLGYKVFEENGLWTLAAWIVTTLIAMGGLGKGYTLELWKAQHEKQHRRSSTPVARLHS